MATKIQFFQKAVEAPGTCAITCEVGQCPFVVPVADWLNDLMTRYQDAEILEFRFQIDPDPGKHCIYAIAQVRYRT